MSNVINLNLSSLKNICTVLIRECNVIIFTERDSATRFIPSGLFVNRLLTLAIDSAISAKRYSANLRALLKDDFFNFELNAIWK